MTGCLKIKNDTYYAVLNLKQDGKYKQKWISTKLNIKGNKRKATEILNELLVKYEEKEINSEPGDVLFTDYIIHWLEKKKNKVEITTWESYRNAAINHFIPYFETLNIAIKDLKPKHITDYYEHEFSLGDKGRNGLSISSIKLHSVILKNILNQALLEEIIIRNPAFKVPLPKKCDNKSVSTFLTASQANELLKLFKGHYLQPLVYITLYYGLRRGEAIGLKWSAIDFKNNSVKINHTITRSRTLIAKDKTKTVSSERKYYLLPEIKEILKQLKEEQKMNKKLFGKSYKDSDYVFTHPDGKIYHPTSVSHTFSDVLSKNNFPKMRFHDLRHSCASILHDKGWELKDIQVWLGHSDIQTTANIYTHISQARKNHMAKDIRNTFSL